MQRSEPRRNVAGYRSVSGVKNFDSCADGIDYPTDAFHQKNRMAFYRFRYERNASMIGSKTPLVGQSWQVS